MYRVPGTGRRNATISPIQSRRGILRRKDVRVSAYYSPAYEIDTRRVFCVHDARVQNVHGSIIMHRAWWRILITHTRESQLACVRRARAGNEFEAHIIITCSAVR